MDMLIQDFNKTIIGNKEDSSIVQEETTISPGQVFIFPAVSNIYIYIYIVTDVVDRYRPGRENTTRAT